MQVAIAMNEWLRKQLTLILQEEMLPTGMHMHMISGEFIGTLPQNGHFCGRCASLQRLCL